MSSTPPDVIRPGRLALGIVAGAAVPIGFYAVAYHPVWPLVLVFGSVIAAFFIAVVLWPIYTLLRRKRSVTVWWTILLGGFLTILPGLWPSLWTIIPTIFDIGERSGGYSIGGVPMVIQGRYTPAGWDHMLTIMLLDFILGAIGGLIGWLIAAGFRHRVR